MSPRNKVILSELAQFEYIEQRIGHPLGEDDLNNKENNMLNLYSRMCKYGGYARFIKASKEDRIKFLIGTEHVRNILYIKTLLLDSIQQLDRFPTLIELRLHHPHANLSIIQKCGGLKYFRELLGFGENNSTKIKLDKYNSSSSNISKNKNTKNQLSDKEIKEIIGE